MTNETNQYVQSFTVFGVPLMAAVTETLAWQGADDLPVEEKQAYAARCFNGLLTASMVVSAKMAEHVGINEAHAHAAPRLEISRLAANLVGDYFRATGDLPDEAAINGILANSQTVLSMAESLPLAPTAVQDDTPELVTALSSLSPVMAALARFSFGEDPRKLGMHLAETFNKKIHDLLDGLENAQSSTADNEKTLRFTELFKACSPLLVASIEAEQQAAANAGDNQPDLDLALKAIWVRFDDGLVLLKQVLSFLFGLGNESLQGGGGSSSRNVKPISAAKQEKAEAKKNPMSFFAKKPSGGMGGQ